MLFSALPSCGVTIFVSVTSRSSLHFSHVYAYRWNFICCLDSDEWPYFRFRLNTNFLLYKGDFPRTTHLVLCSPSELVLVCTLSSPIFGSLFSLEIFFRCFPSGHPLFVTATGLQVPALVLTSIPLSRCDVRLSLLACDVRFQY